MNKIIVLRIAGILGFIFTIFHLAFPFLLPDWDVAFDGMPYDYADIFITLHYVAIAFLAGMGYICTFQTKKLLNSPIKNSVLLLFSSLFIIRIITEFIYWGITFPQSAVILAICIIPVVCFLIAITGSNSSN